MSYTPDDGSAGAAEPGDWFCVYCPSASFNFKWKTFCHKCGRGKEVANSSGNNVTISTITTTVATGIIENDIAPSASLNNVIVNDADLCQHQRERKNCSLCGGRFGNVSEPNREPGDWICAHCQSPKFKFNFKSRISCRECGKARNIQPP